MMQDRANFALHVHAAASNVVTFVSSIRGGGKLLFGKDETGRAAFKVQGLADEVIQGHH